MVKKASKKINTAINNYAFTSTLDLIPPFTPGSLSLKFKKHLMNGIQFLKIYH